MTEIIKIQRSNSNGTHSITIPAKQRKALGWEQGDILISEMQGNKMILKRIG